MFEEMASKLASVFFQPQELCNEDQEAFFSALWPIHQQHGGYEHTSESQEDTLSNEGGTEKPLLGPWKPFIKLKYISLDTEILVDVSSIWRFGDEGVSVRENL